MKNMRKVYRLFVIGVLLLNFHGILIGQNSNLPVITKLTTEDGLTTNIIYSVLQDNHGFVWIATEQGMNKFDGKNLTHFSTGEKRYALSHNRAQTMLLAPDGNIWAGTSSGLNIYDYKADSIVQVRVDTEPLKLVYNDITTLAASNDTSTTWLGTYGNGVNYFNWESQSFHSLELPSTPGVTSPLHVMSLLEDHNNRLWIGTQNNGLYCFNRKDNILEFYQLPETGRFVRTIYQDSYRRIWVGTTKGCYLYNETTNRLDALNYPSQLSDISIGAITEDQNGRLWIGTELFLMTFSARAFSIAEKFEYTLFEYGHSATRLSCPSVNSLFADNENNILIGTAWGGLNILKGSPAKFQLFKHDTDLENSLPGSPVNTICSDGQNHLFVATMGTSRVGLCKLNIITGEVAELPVNQHLHGYVYHTVFYDKSGVLWLGTYNKGLIRVLPHLEQYEKFVYNPADTNSLPANNIRAIHESRNGQLWIGTEVGLVQMDKETRKISRVKLGDAPGFAIRRITEDANGMLWLGTYGNSVVMYNPATNESFFNSLPISPYIVHDIFIDRNTAWIATNGDGLVAYNTSDKTFRVYTESDGLLSNYLASVLCDNLGNVWIGSSKGISKLDTSTQEIVNFNSGDGLQPREFSERAAVRLPNGAMAFAGFGGINVFDPLKVTKDDKCPKVVFTRLFVFNELITPSKTNGKHAPLKQNITLSNQIELQHKQSVFTIEFIGINYNANSKIQYAYLLEGADKTWNNIGNQNSVTFRNLNPGTYTFKVKASSPDAVWNEDNTIAMTIVVHPPFWATGWAYLIYSVLLLILFYFVGYFIIIRIESANNLKIERARREKDEEVHQEKLQFFTNISHELRTPLTLIIGPLESMQATEEDEDKRSNLKIISLNAKRLLAMVNQLLDFRKAERGQMKLKVQYADAISVIRDQMIPYNELKKQKNIHFSLNSKEDSINGWLDAEFIGKALNNLVYNSFKFISIGGTITIEAQLTSDPLGNRMLTISVIDNGNGISEKDLPHIFDRFYQGQDKSSLQLGTGIGLHLVKNLIEMHHGSVEVESKPKIETVFRITIPIDKSAYLKEEFMDSSKEFVATKGSSIDIETENIITANDSTKIPQNDKRKKILIVEDNADIRKYICSILGSGYLIEEAENGAIGLEMISVHEYDLVISDLMMPEMDGIEMCRRIKTSAETDHIPIILLTAKSAIESRIEGLSLGADSYITKPFHPQHLTVRVNKLIELRELLKERYSRKIILGEMQHPDHKAESPEEQFLQKTIAIILLKMIESEFNGDALAAELNISRMGLHRKIKALTGQTTGEFIRNIRLKKACELLTTDGKNVSEVCYSVGFNSPSYFTTCFTEVYKITPSEYAKAMRKMSE
jgi:signal transduction histidine kinase/ligand-binding sensor domain-containing protein/DNA-binding NarL/FixJ family response regulator